MRFVSPALAAIVLVLTVLLPAPANATGGWINDYRVQNGVPRLHANSYLNVKAHEWAVYMATHVVLAHGDLPAFGKYSVIGQNVAMAPAGTPWWDLQQAFIASPEHRANEIDPAYTQVGVGGAELNGVRVLVQDYRG